MEAVESGGNKSETHAHNITKIIKMNKTKKLVIYFVSYSLKY